MTGKSPQLCEFTSNTELPKTRLAVTLQKILAGKYKNEHINIEQLDKLLDKLEKQAIKAKQREKFATLFDQVVDYFTEVLKQHPSFVDIEKYLYNKASNMSLIYAEKRAIQKDILKNGKIYEKTRYARRGHNKYFCETAAQKIQLAFDKLDGIENKQDTCRLYDRINSAYTDYQQSDKTLEDICKLHNDIRSALDTLDFPRYTNVTIRQKYLKTFFPPELASLLLDETKKAREIVLQTCQNKLSEFNTNINNIKEKNKIYNKTLDNAIKVHENYLNSIIQAGGMLLSLDMVKFDCKTKKEYYEKLRCIFHRLDDKYYEELKAQFQKSYEECTTIAQQYDQDYLTLSNECATFLQNLTNRLLELSPISEEQARQWFQENITFSDTLSKKLYGQTKHIITESLIEAYRLTWGKVQNIALDTTKKARSHLIAGSNTIYLNSKQIDKRTLFHEFGHVVEISDPILWAIATSFVEARAKGKPVSLRTLINETYIRNNEVAYPAHFAHPYIGKVYPSGNTEVISMALQILAQQNSPDEVAERIAKDTEDIQLLLGRLLMETDNTPISQEDYHTQ